MGRIKTFLKSTIIGGVIVVLPIAILVFLIKWVVESATDLIQPATDFLTDTWHLPEYAAALIIVIAVIMILFLLGTFVRTRAGGWLLRFIEERLFSKAPGYSTIRETVVQILGTERKPFSAVALAKIFNSETLVTVFITDEHADGSYTVFMPTGPNPMSGNIYHLKNDCVFLVNVPVEEAMRSIISCGAGSTKLIEDYLSKRESAA